MLQKFDTNTLISKFIKALIYNTPIPLIDCVRDDCLLIENCQYIYNTNVIKCTKTGYLNSKDPIKTQAIYRCIHPYEFGTEYTSLTENYKSDSATYDSDTHYYLGRYLDCIKNLYNVNLFPFYNCFSNINTDEMHLNEQGHIELTKNENYTEYLIPIKFNQIYTIAIDCKNPIQMKSIIYNRLGLIKNTPTSYWTDMLVEDSKLKYPFLQYNKPIKYCIHTQDSKLINLQKNLFLLLQVPKNNNSTITILRGDFTCQSNIVYNANCLDLFTQDEFEYTHISPLRLLQVNDKNSYAFSDTLVQYLLGNVINPLDTIDKNIIRTQRDAKTIAQSEKRYKWVPDAIYKPSGTLIVGKGKSPDTEFIRPVKDAHCYNTGYYQSRTDITPQPTSWSTVLANTGYENYLKHNAVTKGVWDIHLQDFLFNFCKNYITEPWVDNNGFVTKEIEKLIVKDN